MFRIIISLCLTAFYSQSFLASAAESRHIPIGDKVESAKGQQISGFVAPKLNVNAISFKDNLALGSVTSKYIDIKPNQNRAKRGSKEAGIYEKVSPSVVLIVTDDAIGSGSIISERGAILTNYHVTKGFDAVAVVIKPKGNNQFSKKDFYRAKVVKYDEVKDLAFIKLTDPPKNLITITLGKKGTIKIGHDVHAIGHPTGETWTYTKGFISQMRNDYEWVTELGVKHKANVIQTQTPINPGNSGGPLINDSGELIGINSFKAEGEALNFAVDISEVRSFIKSKGNIVAEKVVTECVREPNSSERTEENDGTYYYYDFDCNGTIESTFTVPDNPKEPIVLSMDTSGNGKYDEVYIDLEQDGRWDYSYYDTNNDGEEDLIGYHPDGEIEASRYEKVS